MVAAATHCRQAFFKWRFGCWACFIGKTTRYCAGNPILGLSRLRGEPPMSAKSRDWDLIMQFDFGEQFVFLVKKCVYTLDVRRDFYRCWWRNVYTRWMFAEFSTAVGEEMRIHVGCSLRFLPLLVKESVYTLDVRKFLPPISMWWMKQMFGCTPSRRGRITETARTILHFSWMRWPAPSTALEEPCRAMKLGKDIFRLTQISLNLNGNTHDGEIESEEHGSCIVVDSVSHSKVLERCFLMSLCLR